MKRIDKILVACDLSAKATATLAYAADLAIGLKADLIALHVVDACQITAIEQAYGHIFAAGHSEDLETYLHDFRQEALHELQTMLPAACRGRVKCQVLVRQGEPHLQIAREALKQGVDLVVIGEGRHRYFINHLVGTTAGRLLRLLTVPMISLRGQPSRVAPCGLEARVGPCGPEGAFAASG
jgi:nucleotide-binding universal stress UspA family protein